ncbi:MAG TPA: hypothetical protein VFF06_19935 [Polyangia bacterium]|nr:hypothetical protein [Polyangia bacterium]
MSGCAAMGGSTKPTRARVDFHSLKAREHAPLEGGGVLMRAGVIMPDTAARFPMVIAQVHWFEYDESMPTDHNVVNARPPKVERWGNLTLVPYPTFVVGVANRSGHAVRFAADQFHLEDAQGKRYEAFRDRAALAGRIERDIISIYQGLLSSRAVVDGVREKIGRLPLVTGAQEVPDGGEALGLVAFEIDVHNAAELDAWIAGVDHLTLRSDLAPALEFHFDRFATALEVTCPDGAVTPSLEKCKPGNLVSSTGEH